MKKIVIIHSSSIICRGLTDVIKGYFNVDVFVFPSVEEFISRKVDARKLIVFTEHAENIIISQIRNQDAAKEVVIIQLHNKSESIENTCFDSSISIWAEPADFYNIIHPQLAAAETHSNEIENSNLTIREKDVLREVSTGLTNKEIAEKLHISIHTVISHRKNITAKLGIKSISGLTVYAIINNIVDTNSIDPNSLI
ncbi:MAG: hypothetical protein C0599_03325 [Salinivirgaceae bacterium]|nr:MAG: hypothetical protein C0599_03325 [Salinivirgaceae bacterium]